MKVRYWVLDMSRANEIGLVRPFQTMEEAIQYVDYMSTHPDQFKITDSEQEMIDYCDLKYLNWREFILTGKPTPVILLTDHDSEDWLLLKDKALIEHGAEPIKYAKYRKDEDYRSPIALDWLFSSGARMFLYLNL